MSSGITVTIKLEPFLQDFLRSHFNCHEKPFRFPKGEDLSYALQRILNKLPDNYISPDPTPELFEVEIPYMHDRDPFYYRYVSPTTQKAYAFRVKKFFDVIFHEYINDYRRAGFEKKECVEIFLDQHNLPIKYFDRLIKDYQRWFNKQRAKKFRKNHVKNTSKIKPRLSFA